MAMAEPRARVDVIQFAGFDQRVDDGGAIAAAVTAAEGPVAAPDGDAQAGAQPRQSF